MNANNSIWQNIYLRSAGLLSAVMGIVSSWILVLAFRGTEPRTKLILAIVGFASAFVGYAMGKDIMDRIRNREESLEFLTNGQMRLAYVGTRFGFALSRLMLLFALASVVFFSMPVVERASFFCGPVIKSEHFVERCLRNFLSYP